MLKMLWLFFHPGPDEHVPAGDPGGGDDTALVLPGSHHRQEQTAPQEPGGRYRVSWGSQDTRLYDTISQLYYEGSKCR